MKSVLQILILNAWIIVTLTQDYQVADISCDFASYDIVDNNEIDIGSGDRERISARLRKPPGFKGHPQFADSRNTDPVRSSKCQIRLDVAEGTGTVYNLLVTDFSYCGVIKKDGYVNLRIWFPQLDGVLLATDQEVIIMCQPAAPTIIENRAAGFAGSLPSAGRVSGIVEESPGRLEYEVSLLRETVSGRVAGQISNTHIPVDQAVPLGSRLQLRAKINTQSAWKYAKLIEVSVSGNPNDPYSPGHVQLVKDGCRMADYTSIVPSQPIRAEDDSGEVRLDFEAFMLDSKLAGSSQLWIHASIKACVEAQECLPEFCLDLFQPSGHGRRRRRRSSPKLYSNIIEMADGHNESLSYILHGKSLGHEDMIFEDIIESVEESITVLPASTEAEQLEAHIPTLPSLPKPQSLSGATPMKQSLVKEGPYTNIGDNVGVTVIMPEEFFMHTEALYHSCATFMVLSGVLGLIVMACAAILCCLTSRLHKSINLARSSTLETVIKNHNTKYGVRDRDAPIRSADWHTNDYNH